MVTHELLVKAAGAVLTGLAPPQLRGARWSRRYSTSSRRAPKCEPQSQMYVLKRRVIQNWLGRVVVGINEGRHELDAAASLSDCDCRTVAARLVK